MKSSSSLGGSYITGALSQRATRNTGQPVVISLQRPSSRQLLIHSRQSGLMRFPVSITRNESVLPRWGRELAHQLKHGGSQAPPETLGPATALHELLATASAFLAGRPMRSNDDRKSLRDDLKRAMNELGPKLAATAAPALAPLKADFDRLPKLLDDANGALAVVGLGEATLEALKEQAMLEAAWNDVCDAFEGDEYAGICELRIKQLAELVELRGGDWRSTAEGIGRILFDDRPTLANRGAIELSDDDWLDAETLLKPAGVPLDERFRLARAEVVSAPLEGDSMVGWVCFRNASLHRTNYQEREGVEFFGHQLWPEAITSGYPDTTSPREGFKQDSHKRLFRSMPDEPFVLVSVPLGHGTLASAVERARSAAQDLVRVAQPHSEWVLIKGAAIWAPAGNGDGDWFGDPLDAREYPTFGLYSPEFEPTGHRLANLEPAVVRRMLRSELQMRNAVRDVEWAEELSNIRDEPQRLALSTRLIERTLPAADRDHWTKPLIRYLKEWWADLEARRLISDTAHGGVDLLDSIMSPDNIGKWRDRLTPHDTGGPGYTVRFDETLNSVEELIEDLPEGSMQRRIAAELAHHAGSGGNWLRLLDDRGGAFDILLARLVRQRNVILHGADTVPAVVASVMGFALRLQSLVIYEQLDAASTGELLLKALERNRIRLERVRKRLGKPGASPASSIFEKASNEATAA
jgi:hypothetical protein